MRYFAYIIRSKKDAKNYIGFTSNLQKRLLWHNLGRNTSTKSRVPFEYVFCKDFESKKEALQYEHWLKTQKGGLKVKELIKDFNMPR